MAGEEEKEDEESEARQDRKVSEFPGEVGKAKSKKAVAKKHSLFLRVPMPFQYSFFL